MEKYKPFIKDLIRWYYNQPEKGAGGYLHIVLDDGNIEHPNIIWCREQCEQEGDTFGMFLADILILFTEDELEKMYDDNWWGMWEK